MCTVAAIKRAPFFCVTAEIIDRLTHRHTVGICFVQPLWVEHPSHRFTANQCRRKAHAFLISEANNFERVRQSQAPPIELFHACNRRENAEQAVVSASISHAVLMRAGHHHRRERHTRFVATNNIAQRVKAGGHTGITHKTHQIFACLLVLFGQVGTSDLRRVFGECGEHIRLLENFRSKFHDVAPVSGCRARQCRAISMRRVTHTRSCFSM